MLASTSCAETMIMSSDVKSDKTFEEIVERLAALFKLKPRPGDRDYEDSCEIETPSATSNPPEPAIIPEESQNNEKK